VLVANEAEQATAANEAAMATVANPEGSVSIINLSAGAASATVTTASFSAFNSKAAELKAKGVRLMAGEAGFTNVTVAQDLEPEYIAISLDGKTAFVTLQENNAIAILDIASGKFTDIVPLGLKSFMGLPFDGSDRDGPPPAAATATATRSICKPINLSLVSTCPTRSRPSAAPTDAPTTPLPTKATTATTSSSRPRPRPSRL
jgi:DNA-binding beta-propeller fold protein YncE